MKKFTIAIVILLSATVAFGQFSIGPKIGYNTSKLTTELDSVKSDLSNNFLFGAFVRIGKKIYVQPEVNYLTIGGVFEDHLSANPFKQEISMKSIEIPVIIGWRMINFGVGNIRILLGPSASIVINKDIKSTEGENYIKPITDADIKDLVWGFNFGAGVDLFMFTLDVRYQMGLNEVISKVQDFSFNSKNNLFAVSLGWKIL